MKFEGSDKLADVLHTEHHLLPVVRRFGIRLGFGDKTINEVCKDSQVDEDLLVLVLNAFLNKAELDPEMILTQSLPALVNYLQTAHNDYLEQNIPSIEKLISTLADQNIYSLKEVKLLKEFFAAYKKELIIHIKREEEVVYPYALEVFEAFNSQKAHHSLLEKMKLYSIHEYEKEHDNVEEKLFDLKNIIIKYVKPAATDAVPHQILQELFHLEKDLNEHARIEDGILVSQVAYMEKCLLKPGIADA